MISIVIPVFNAEKYLLDCLMSIENQTYSNFECLLIDDGSTDSSGEICDEFSSRDTRFKVFHNDNHGVSYARNFGIEKAQGEFITFVDSDDLIDSSMLEKMHHAIQQSNADICFCKYDKFDENTRYFVEEKNLKSLEIRNDREYFETFLKYFFISQTKDSSELQMGSSWRILFRRQNVKAEFDSNIYMCEDLIFVLNNLVGLKKIAVVDESFYHYRIFSSSASHRYKKNFLENQKNLIEALQAFVSRLNFSTNENECILDGEFAVQTYYLFSNEIKYRHINKQSFKKRIKAFKKEKIYQYFTLKNMKKIRHSAFRIKYFIVYLIVKTGLYKIL